MDECDTRGTHGFPVPPSPTSVVSRRGFSLISLARVFPGNDGPQRGTKFGFHFKIRWGWLTYPWRTGLRKISFGLFEQLRYY